MPVLVEGWQVDCAVLKQSVVSCISGGEQNTALCLIGVATQTDPLGPQPNCSTTGDVAHTAEVAAVDWI